MIQSGFPPARLIASTMYSRAIVLAPTSAQPTGAAASADLRPTAAGRALLRVSASP